MVPTLPTSAPAHPRYGTDRFDGGRPVPLPARVAQRLLPLLALALPLPAMAGFDGQGEPPPPTSGQVEDPVLLWSAASAGRGSIAVGALLDAADAPLLRATPDGLQAQVDDLFRLRLGGRVALSDRIDLGLGVPLVLSYSSDVDGGGGPTLGDTRLYGRIGLTTPSRSTTAPALALVPELRLPTGASAAYLGDESVGGSLLLAGSGGVGPVLLTGNLGLDLRQFEEEANVRPGAGVLGGMALGLRASERLVVSGELRVHQRLDGVPLDGAPEGYIDAARGAEAMITSRARLGPSVFLTAGLGGGVIPGFGAARLRAMLGVGGRFGGPEPELSQVDPDVDPVPDVDPTAPVPVLVRVQDESGQPVDATARVDGGAPVQITTGQAELRLPPGEHLVEVEADGFGGQARELELAPGAPAEEVRIILLPTSGDRSLYVDLGSPEDRPVDDARVSLDGRPIGESASGGGIVVRGLGTDPVTVEARADAFRPTRVELTPGSGEVPVELLLARERGAVQLVVTDGRERPIPGVRARFAGPDRLGPYDVGPAGERTFVLRPGAWQVLVSHPAHGLQQRGVDVVDRDTELTTVRFVLQPPEQGQADLELRVVDPSNTPVAGVRVQLDGVDYGRTSTAGSLRLSELSVGPRRLSIVDPDLRPLTRELLLHDGLQEELVVARYQPGTTLFRARSPQGMAPDATVRAAGPSPRDPLPLGKDGVEQVRLDPGAWQVLFSSPSLGMSQQQTQVPDTGELTVVDAVLGEPEAPGTQLDVTVVDPEGQPVDGARIALDGADVGRTARQGGLTITDAGRGRRTVSVERSPFAPLERTLSLTRDEASTELALAWAVGAVRVKVQHDGTPVSDAVVRMGGPRFVPATPVGPDGSRLFDLEPGDWQILVSSPTYGLDQIALSVPDRPQLTEVAIELAPARPDVAQTLVRVQAPDGSPIPQARVELDDRPAVPATGGYAAFDDVSPGKHRIQVQAPDFEPMVVEGAELQAGTAERIVPLAWVPRILDVAVQGPGGQGVPSRIIAKGRTDRETRTDAQGRASLTLEPGPWDIFVVSDGLRVARERVDLSQAREAPLSVPLRQARVKVVGDRLEIDEQIYFATGSSTLGPSSADLLDEVADTLLAHPELVRVEIGGHTDATGSVAVNMRLSAERAQAVVEALVDRGVPQERLVSEGYGPTRPQADNDTEAGRARNRRVEFVSETTE